MALGNTQSSAVSTSAAPTNSGTPLAVVTTLFFMWGSLTSLNDVLIPHFQHVFKLDLKFSMLVQTAFFASYFVFSLPSAKIIDWMGYHKAMVTGLLVMGLGAFLFVPAAKVPSFGLFLAALIVLAAGITLLQVAANPYVAVLGRPETASSRLNLTQAFNSLGTTIAPWIGGFFILSSAAIAMNQTPVQQAASVIKPYVGLGIALVLLALVIGSFKLPKIAPAEHHSVEKTHDSIWKHPSLVYGAIGIFVYVGAEVAIGSSIANYLALDNIGHLVSRSDFPDDALRYQEALRAAAKYISLYWGGAMVGRFMGAALLKGVKAAQMGLVFVVALLLVFIPYIPLHSSGIVSNILNFLADVRPLIILSAITAAVAAAIGLIRGTNAAIKTNHLLAICTAMAAVLVTVSVANSSSVAMWSILLVGFFNSIMFPSIFTMGIAELGPLTGKGSGIMIMAIVGGAIIPLIVGYIGDNINARSYEGALWGQGIHYALIVAAVCYLYLLFFAVNGSKPNSERYTAKAK
jgi:FHS family L-fucose permease-like MFS transporter